jgi:acetyltransferase-like isoleucine patch superfamily enzyme
MKFSLLKNIFRFCFKKRAKENVKFFTKDFFKNKNYEIGNYTYGLPKVLDWDDGTTLKIGNYCSISINVTILLGGEHNYKCISTYPIYSLSKDHSLIGKDRNSKGSVFIGHDVWIGANVTILSGVKIGNGAIIGAGSVVTKDVTDFAIIGGNPARFIKKRFDDDIILKINDMAWWNWDENKVKSNKNLLMKPLLINK